MVTSSQMALLVLFTNGLIVGLFAILGHVYPVYLKFKVAKLLQLVQVSSWESTRYFTNTCNYLLYCIEDFKYVSLASIVAAICCVIGSLIIQDYILLVVSFLVSIILIIRHRLISQGF